MRVVYTHDIFSRQNVGGISRYYTELIRNLADQFNGIQVFAGHYANRHLAELEGRGHVIGQFQRGKFTIRFPRHLRNQWRQNHFARSANADIVHHTYYSFARPFPSARLVVTVHDLIPERFPKQFGWKSRLLSAAKRRTCTKADQIIAISETTKADLVEHFGISPQIIDVIYLGNSLSQFAQDESHSPSCAPYMLYVGARPGYKNCKTFWEAYSRSPHVKENFRVICFGGGTFSNREQRLLHKLNVSQLVSHANGDDRELSRYYRHAAALVYPSLYEGFGLPPVEAMSFGCPIVASTGGAIPEIVGPAGFYFQPDDSDMLRSVLEKVLSDSSLQIRLREEMQRRALRFSWQQTAQQTLECYQKVAA